MESRHSLNKRWEVKHGASDCAALAGIGASRAQRLRQRSSCLAKTGRRFPAVAANLAMIKDGGQGIGQNSNHREHDECDVLMHGRLFEMTVGSDGLECGDVDSPAASAQLVNEHRRDGAEVHIGRIEVRALVRDFFFFLVSKCADFLNFDTLDLLDSDGFDDLHQAVGYRPVDLRQMPKRKIFVTSRPLASGGSRGEALGLGQ